MRTYKIIIFGFITMLVFSCCKGGGTNISLAGEWQFTLDSTDIGIKESWHTKEFSERISLPGTTDEAGKGVTNSLEPAITKQQILHPTRKYSYVGPAWYKKEVNIPNNWKEKNIHIFLHA